MKGVRSNEYGIFVTGDTASSGMSPGYPYTIVMVGVEFAGGKGRG